MAALLRLIAGPRRAGNEWEPSSWRTIAALSAGCLVGVGAIVGGVFLARAGATEQAEAEQAAGGVPQKSNLECSSNGSRGRGGCVEKNPVVAKQKDATAGVVLGWIMVAIGGLAVAACLFFLVREMARRAVLRGAAASDGQPGTRMTIPTATTTKSSASSKPFWSRWTKERPEQADASTSKTKTKESKTKTSVPKKGMKN